MNVILNILDAKPSMPKTDYHYLKHHSTMGLRMNWMIILERVNIKHNYKEKQEVYAIKHEERTQNSFYNASLQGWSLP